MKMKTIKIKTVDEGLADFEAAFKKAQSGKGGKKKSGVFFSTIDAARKILTKERIKLLKYIKTFKPDSIYQLAKGVDKNIKNVSQNLNYLSEFGLVELEEKKGSRSARRPILLSDHITLELNI